MTYLIFTENNTTVATCEAGAANSFGALDCLELSPDSSSFMTYLIFTENNTTVATCEAGAANSFEALEFSHGLCGVCVAKSLLFLCSVL